MVSENKPPTRDRHRKAKPAQWKDVGMAMVRYSAGGVSCNCGWDYPRKREKVMEDAIDRHFARRHGGRGLRL